MKQLEQFKKFQESNPEAHVGGSIGLFLHGYNLQRDLSESDLDVTICVAPTIKDSDFQQKNVSMSDFDYCFFGSAGFKIDVRIANSPYVKINYQGFIYNVSIFSQILFWKFLYAHKGIEKHQNDLKHLQKRFKDKLWLITSSQIPF